MEEKRNYNSYPTMFFAGFWIRFLAYIIDVVIAHALGKIIINPVAVVLNLDMNASFPSVYTFLRLVIFLTYFVLAAKWTQGQSLGKIIFGLRIVSLKEENLTWTTILIREACLRYLHKILWILYLVVPFSDKHQSLSDMLCDTAVIREKMFLTENFFKHRFEL